MAALAGGGIAALAWAIALLNLLARLILLFVLILHTLSRLWLIGLIHRCFSYVCRQGHFVRFAVPTVK